MVAEGGGRESLYFVRAGSEVVWHLQLETGEEEVFEASGGVLQCYWKVSAEGIFFYRRTERGAQLAVHDLQAGETRDVCPILPRNHGLLDVAPDGSSLLYDLAERTETDLVRVAPFPLVGQDR